MESRTPDLLHAMQALYQLSYDPAERPFRVGFRGFRIRNRFPKGREKLIQAAPDSKGRVGETADLCSV